MRICYEASLKGLDVDYVDLYYQHHVDTSVPMEVQVGSIGNKLEKHLSGTYHRKKNLSVLNGKMTK